LGKPVSQVENMGAFFLGKGKDKGSFSMEKEEKRMIFRKSTRADLEMQELTRCYREKCKN
jgi:hypothetical protein